jgi:proteic killer suppression protein
MIKDFHCKDTQALYEGGDPRRFRAFRAQAERKLQMLDSAVELMDLRSPPGNRLEKLSGNKEGLWSIRINGQWRICFTWENKAPCQVEIVDYH